MPYRVLHVLDHSWPVLSGYSVRSRYLATAQMQAGHLPNVVTSPLHQLDDPKACDTAVDGVPYSRTPLVDGISRLAISKRWPIVREAAVVLLLKRHILQLVDLTPFDVIHAHSPALCGLAAWKAARSKRLPFVYEIRAFWEDAAVDQRRTRRESLRYGVSRSLETFVARRAGAVVGIAKPILDDLQMRGVKPKRLFHVPNGVDAQAFHPAPRDVELAEELRLGKEPVLGFIGTLYRYEGIAWLVRAVIELRRRGTPCQLLVAGYGEDFKDIESAVRTEGAADYIRLLGTIPHDQVRRYYSLMDLMVYPRHSTRLTELVSPLKPLEALASGKAILASNIGGIRELVEAEKTALLFQPNNIDDFCRQAQRLIQQEDLRRELGEQARQLILRDKDWKILAQRYDAVYRTAIES